MTIGAVATRLEPRGTGGDGGRVAAELRGGSRVHGRDRRDGHVELAMGVQAPRLELVVGGEARREVGRIRGRRRQGRVEPCDQRAEVLRHRGHRVQVGRRPGTRRGPRGTRRGLVQVFRVRDERPEHGHRGGAAVAGDGLRPARQARDAGEPSLLREVRGELQVRVEAGLDPPVALEEQPVAQHDRGVELVAAEGALAGIGQVRRGPRPRGREAGRGAADEGGLDAAGTCRVVRAFGTPPGSRASAGIVRPSAIATASASQAPSPSAASRTAPEAGSRTKGIA